jgi:hypothetical protein
MLSNKIDPSDVIVSSAAVRTSFSIQFLTILREEFPENEVKFLGSLFVFYIMDTSEKSQCIGNKTHYF